LLCNSRHQTKPLFLTLPCDLPCSERFMAKILVDRSRQGEVCSVSGHCMLLRSKCRAPSRIQNREESVVRFCDCNEEQGQWICRGLRKIQGVSVRTGLTSFSGCCNSGVALFNLMEQVADVWVKVSHNGALGALFIMWGTTGRFYGTSAVRMAKWIETLGVVCGVIMILHALSWGLGAYYY
jgi:hypothetical protein